MRDGGILMQINWQRVRARIVGREHDPERRIPISEKIILQH
jgi:hypothetical protein